ncbi:(E2-Independent) E3 Ubiquitin-Conjugating Enzyme Fats [Manis pentadactyla]|nr:(E2-Independent) E3 Ubiquitin-Conjugating Enzyme Fats [Manis pentadactyla]
MQHPGIPTKARQRGYAVCREEATVHRTFQIKTFSTELKNHVMFMDFVKSNWFPSQRRAKVCVVHRYQGLKTAEQAASRYEIHSRLFSSPKDHSAWEQNERLSNAGLRDSQYHANDQIAFKNLHSDVTEKKSDFATEETLASHSTKMISSIVISQLIDENKSEESGAVLPGPCAVAQPHMHPVKQSLAHRHGVVLSRAFAFFPGRLGVQTLAEERGPETEPPPQEERLCGGPQKGFASITVTARRVGPPASGLGWEALGGSLRAKCPAQDTLLGVPFAWASGAHARQQHGHFACVESPRSSSGMRLKVPAAHAQRGEDHEYWVTHVESREDRFPPGKRPLVFSSCVHLRVSQQCPKSIYFLDRSLCVPIEPPQLAGPKMHRSVLSLNLNCSSHLLTPDGADGTANRGPVGSDLPETLTEGTPDLLAPHWRPALPGRFLKENPLLGPLPLGTGPCPRGGSLLLENTDFTDVGTDRDTLRKGQEDHVPHCHTGGRANRLSIHIPGWSYTAGEYTCSDLVVKIKECKRREGPSTSKPKPEPAALEPAPAARPEAPALSEDYSERQQTPASSLTLQEALEIHKPQFISRSRERLKKVERAVQQRKAQRKESLGPKQSLPARASKRRCTVPHPLSDNLFKPKERYISEKEMHMRSKRIYNNLPEVKKKKEEQRKRVILQSNRLRAEVFKKQLLDQLLQRNAV